MKRKMVSKQLYVFIFVIVNYIFIFVLGVFSETMIWQNTEPMMFWLDIIHDVPEIAKFAQTVLSVRPHVAGCERVWSLSVNILTKGRSKINSYRFGDMVQVSAHVVHDKMTCKLTNKASSR